VSEIDTAGYRERLVAERDRLAHAVGHLHDENAGSIEDELGELSTGGVDNHMADTASATYERELDAVFEEGAQHILGEVEAALGRLDDGSFGSCDACGKPIGAERLAAIPWARLCIDDQRRAE
jgi:RNA polymerase-binding transcription factor DksA